MLYIGSFLVLFWYFFLVLSQHFPSSCMILSWCIPCLSQYFAFTFQIPFWQIYWAFLLFRYFSCLYYWYFQITFLVLSIHFFLYFSSTFYVRPCIFFCNCHVLSLYIQAFLRVFFPNISSPFQILFSIIFLYFSDYFLVLSQYVPISFSIHSRCFNSTSQVGSL